MSHSLGLHQGSFKYMNSTISAKRMRNIFKFKDFLQLTIDPVKELDNEHLDSFIHNDV
jgi:hypothetical protein